LLPSRTLLFRSRGDHVIPRYLSTEDAPWIEALIAVCDAHLGRTVLERRGALGRCAAAVVAQHAVPDAVVDGVRHVLEREYKSQVAAPIPPAELRMIVFEEAARGEHPDYDGALLRAAERVQLSVDVLLEALFADRATARRLLPSERTVSPAAIVDAYDLAVIETILLRSESVTVELHQHVRAIARFARRAGLVCTFTALDSGGRFEVSGPLALLRPTTRYGHALFKFFGALAATPSYRLEARCIVDGERLTVRIADEDRRFGGAVDGAAIFDVDTPVERALQRELRRVDRGWQMQRSGEGSALSPDFELVRDATRVFVEIVEDVGAEYLASRAAALPANVVLCVDERLSTPELGNRAIVRYRRRIDPGALIDAAEQLSRST